MKWSPCKRTTFIRKLYKLGFDGPFKGKRHHFMVYKNHRLAIPSNREYSVSQLKMMLIETELILEQKISIDEWNELL